MIEKTLLASFLKEIEQAQKELQDFKVKLSEKYNMHVNFIEYGWKSLELPFDRMKKPSENIQLLNEIKNKTI